MSQKDWQEDDNLAVARLVLVVNDSDPNPAVPSDHPEYVRTLHALGIDNNQLNARINMFRSNHPDWRGGNPMNGGDAVFRRSLGQMVTSPVYVRMCGTPPPAN